MVLFCPDQDTLARYGDLTLSTVVSERVAHHVETCASCRALVAGLKRTVTPILTPELATPPPEDTRPFVPPARIGRYVVGDAIGAGGMGVVYGAHDPELDRKIALKIVRATGADEGSAGRVQREARAIAKLSHPNVIAVHDVGTVEGRTFLAMEFAEGGTLREWMRG